MSAKRRSLGKGLDALLAGSTGSAAPVAIAQESGDRLRDVPVDRIQRGRYQPRRDFDPESLEELASSIRVQGLMQPIVLRSIGEEKYEIIAGERRWRAAQLAGLESVPAVLKDVDDEAAIAMALIENIQREDLNPIEEATALSRLQSEFELTQQQVADAVGKSRSAVANLLRLMSLEPEVRTLLERGDLDMGHARCLLGLTPAQQPAAARQVVARDLSVRQTEALVRHLQAEQKPEKARVIDPDIRRLQDDLSQRLGSRVEIRHQASGKGKVVLDYSSLDELDGILAHIK